MNKYKATSLLFLLLVLSQTACKKAVDLGIGPIGDSPNVIEVMDVCQILSLVRAEGDAIGLSIQMVYNQDGLAFVSGFQDFNEILYENGKIVGAINSNSDDYLITFGFDGNDQLTIVNFSGRDGAGVPFENISILSYDAEGRLAKMSLSLPIFSQQAVDLHFEYDENKNITKVKKKVNGGFETLLVNESFDDKKSPFLDQKLGQIMSYFMSYTLLVGDANYTYFLNQNNVTKSIITNNSGRIELSTDYDYNDSDFPTTAYVTRLFEGRLKNLQERFTYLCE